MRTYEAGQGIQAERPADINRRPKRNAPPPAADENKEEKAPNTWKANKQISKALDEAFYKTFKVCMTGILDFTEFVYQSYSVHFIVLCTMFTYTFSETVKKQTE